MISAYNMGYGAVYFIHAGLNVGFAKFREVNIPTVTAMLEVGIGLFFSMQFVIGVND